MKMTFLRLSLLIVVFINLTSQVFGQLPPGVPLPGAEQCQERLNLLFLVDKSGSIKPKHWILEKEFLLDMIDTLWINPDYVRVSVLLFANDVHFKFDFNKFVDGTILKQEIANLICEECERGKTATGSALEAGRDILFNQENGARRGAKNVVLVITDGRSTEKKKFVEKAAVQMKMVATVVAVGVGNIKEDELKVYASSEELVFSAKKFTDLKGITKTIANAVCEASSEKTASAETTMECQPEWVKKSPNGNPICYKFFEDKEQHMSADKICKELGGFLAMPKTKEEQDIVHGLRAGKIIWIGLTDTAKEGDFIWSDGTSSTEWSNWWPGEPNNYARKEDCAVMHSKGAGEWVDNNCIYHLAYICQKQPEKLLSE